MDSMVLGHIIGNNIADITAVGVVLLKAVLMA